MTDPEAVSLIPHALEGDKDAREKLLSHALSLATARVGSVVRNRADVEDVSQVAMLRVLRNLHTYDSSKSKFVTWVSMISTSCSLDFLRRRKAKSKLTLAEPIELHDVPRKDVKDPLAGMLLEEAITKATAILSKGEMDVCNMYSRSVKQKTIGDCLGVSRLSVCRTLNRIRMRSARRIDSR